ncbi:MAG TPA: hypothetical protein VKA01_01755 [Vicinamibacteria bacterium]|nr:hypothetical protein [Vicinamibacteria bacterium]
MKPNAFLVLVVSLLGAGLPQASSPAALPAKATLVLTGGRIWTSDSKRPWATAIAVAPGGILAVGDDDEVAALAAPDARRVPLRGRFVMPGINDAHIHFLRARCGSRSSI